MLMRDRIVVHPAIPSLMSDAAQTGSGSLVSEKKYDQVLGVHMVGPHATDLISEACLALQIETTTEEIAKTIHPHPTLGEAMMQAAESVYGMAIDA